MSSVNIFFQSIIRLLILLTLSFSEQFFYLNLNSSLSIIHCVNHIFGVVSQEPLPYSRSRGFVLFLLGVLYFTVGSAIHSELISVHTCLTFPIFLHSSIFL